MKSSGILQTFFNDCTDPDSENSLTRLQKQVDQLRLNLRVKPVLPEPKQLDEAALAVYLSLFKDDRPSEVAAILIRQYTRKLGVAELQLLLKTKLSELNAKIGEQSYALIVEPYHSTEWIAELSLRHLTQLPIKLINIEENFRFRSHSLENASTLVMLDDCAYSGDQLATSVLPNLYKALSKAKESTNVTFLCVIAYMTRHAQQRAQKTYPCLQERFKDKVNVDFQLIVGEFVPSISELPFVGVTKEEIVQVLEANDFDILKRFVLIWADWKKPDYMSYISHQCSKFL